MSKEQLYFIGAKALIQNSSGAVLLLSVTRPDRTYWDLPGGRINEGESAEQALSREVEEETGIAGLTGIQLIGMDISSKKITYTTGKDKTATAGLAFAVYTCHVGAAVDDLRPEDTMTASWHRPEEAVRLLESEMSPYLINAIRVALSV